MVFFFNLKFLVGEYCMHMKSCDALFTVASLTAVATNDLS